MSAEPLIAEHEKAEIRKKNFEESKLDPSKHKYGLFSFAGTLAISPNSYDRILKPRRNSEGAVITEPRNFMASPVKTGKLSDALFSQADYISSGDKYKDPPKPYLKEKINAERMMKSHNVAFKPPGPVEMITVFESLPTERQRTKRRRDPDGNVIFEPKNFYTSPAKKGAPNTTPGVTFGGNFEYIPEPYDRIKDLKRKERKEHHGKMPDKPFKPTKNFPDVFNKDEHVFDIHKEIKKVMKKPRPVKIAQHDSPFKPNDSGKKHVIDAIFGTIPEYLPDPFPVVMRKSVSPKVPWKGMNVEMTRPTPSISMMGKNIRSEFSI